MINRLETIYGFHSPLPLERGQGVRLFPPSLQGGAGGRLQGVGFRG